ncbi:MULTISPECIES: hypothetical protein [Paenibacillus]|uniref:hypothetical protein n=1 Tax=Paenibacillus TaxID=44249 RepID=UPI0022B8C97B|nr:hypothetical protein [Paenibacillus caseinilyticus]MCZ8522148.1 hypothetical protein [Paenibacillus caseinilyticus]
MALSLQFKAALLKSHEPLAYRIAYHLLRTQESAAEAAMKSLLELAQDQRFFWIPGELQRKKVSEAVIRHCLELKKREARECPAGAVH